MATLQELRDYLTSNYADLANLLDPDEQMRFQNSLARLQTNWDSIASDQVKVQGTLQEMHKYAPVWQKLEGEGLVYEALPSQLSASSSPAPTTSQPQFSTSTLSPPQPVFASNSRPAPASVQATRYTHATEEPVVMSSQSSQQAIDKMQMWDRRAIAGKEIFTHSLGGLIVLATVIISFVAILSIGNANSFAAAKDVLLLMDGLVGVVLGYYFGRTPADVRADRAERDAQLASSERDQMVASVSTILDGANIVQDARGGVDSIHLNARQVEQLRQVLRRHTR